MPDDDLDAASARRNQQANRRVIVVVGLVTLAIIAWNLYVELVRH